MATPDSANGKTPERKVLVRFARNERVFIDESIANSGDDDAILAAARAARKEQNLPLSLQPTTVTQRTPSTGDYVMEAISAVNRPSANLLDVLTSPIQYPIAAVQQGTLTPRGQGFFQVELEREGSLLVMGQQVRLFRQQVSLAQCLYPLGSRPELLRHFWLRRHNSMKAYYNGLFLK